MQNNANLPKCTSGTIEDHVNHSCYTYMEKAAIAANEHIVLGALCACAL